ncbi:MAG: protein-disulfide reductase DsbD domain-containing protein [Verrucomicrobiaceae bacterium]
MKSLVSALLLAMTPPDALAAEEEIQGVDISLISNVRTVQAGTPFSVGLHLQHHHGFHTYWKSPGIVGLPTAITWNLPPGFTAGDIRWPYPEQSLMAGHPCHGYDRDVLLVVEITPPKSLTAKKITLTASTQWMCCAQECFPGFQDFTLTLPVGIQEKPNPKTSPLFLKSAKELPQPDPTFTPVIRSTRDAHTITLELTLPQKPKDLYFFSADGQVSSSLKQSHLFKAGGSTTLTLDRSQFSPKKRPTLPGVLKVDDRFILIDPSYPQ